jgi:hypothetical protein
MQVKKRLALFSGAGAFRVALIASMIEYLHNKYV